jgi:DNA-binding protein H-NS
MNLTDMSVEQLQQLQDQIGREIKLRRARDKKEVLSKIRAMAAAGGYTLEELVAGAAASDVVKAGRTVAPKYRHHQNPDLTWTGRGKQPRWIAEYLAAGKSLSDLLIS